MSHLVQIKFHLNTNVRIEVVNVPGSRAIILGQKSATWARLLPSPPPLFSSLIPNLQLMSFEIIFEKLFSLACVWVWSEDGSRAPSQSDLVVDGTRRQVGSPGCHINESDENGGNHHDQDEQDEKKGESLLKVKRPVQSLPLGRSQKIKMKI